MSKLVRIEIRYYAQLREKLGLDGEEAELEFPATEDDILRRLIALHPAQEKLILASRAAIDDEYLPRGAIIQEAAAVDIISPVSGG